ncbi:MAG: hypothetical protein ETSY2_18120 [Candidatus Entotheonella gemina]|uniref:Uncharacterized protein n=1 Tax=Candidatus Entotheonella gemina TaxID=1429439 RepID=W4M7G5_9BACT|nr:MAG: hypothetical protein ETSY2_18120 [Candidatus Entotheonella gemina]
MTIAFRTRHVSIPSGTGRRNMNDSVSFGSNVRSAAVTVNGFQLDYVRSDHHINVVEIDTDLVSISGNDVHFRIQADYADKNRDDGYRGYVQVLVIADVD